MRGINSRVSALLLMLTLQILTGCKVGPNYQRPMQIEEECFVDPVVAQDAVVECEGAEPSEWWLIFDDPQLEQYIYESAEYNLDVKMAACRILEAKAQRCIALAALYPYFDGEAYYDHYFFGVDLTGLFVPSSAIPASSLKDINIDLSSLGFNMRWELDLFGRIRRQVEAASYLVGAAIEDRRDILVSIFGEVAQNYIEIRGYQAQIEVIQESLKALNEKLSLTTNRRDAGLDADLQASQVQADVESLRAQLPPLIAGYYSGIYRLSVLTGRSPNALLPDFREVKPLPKVPDIVSAGLCCRLLERRPDVRYAERELAAATANVGVAEATLYPDISLKGFLGFLSINTDIIKTNNIFSWSGGADVLTPLFHGGQLKANLKGYQAKAAEQYFNYEQTILNAVQEVESAIAKYTKQKNALESTQKAEDALENVYRLTGQLYEKGVRNQLTLIDAKYNYLKMKDNAVQSHVQALVDLTTLYKALGGGWQISP